MESGQNSDTQDRVVRAEALSAGYWGSVERVHFRGGKTAIRKSTLRGHPGIGIEAEMLKVLAERTRLPVPKVLSCDGKVLLLEDMPGGHLPSDAAQVHAAELLAELHSIHSPDGRFGLEFDTVIGPLPQPNAWRESWPEFFGEQRLLAMARLAEDSGMLPSVIKGRLEFLVRRLGEFLPARPEASLLHGDVWTGNVLCAGERVTAFLDPSLSYSDAEVELAFISLFATFGEQFFVRYAERRPIEPEFWTRRKDVYNLYPLLVHVRLFGETYLGQLEGCLRRLRF